MNGKDADVLARKMAIELRRNNFVACHDILKYAQEAQMTEPKPPVALAEIGIDLRWLNKLEGGGYIYLSDLDGVDLDDFIEIAYMSHKAVAHIKEKVLTARGQIREAELEALEEQFVK